MSLFYNEDQQKLYELVTKHGSWSPADLLEHQDVRSFIGYRENDHGTYRHRLAGRLQFLKKRLKKFGVKLT